MLLLWMPVSQCLAIESPTPCPEAELPAHPGEPADDLDVVTSRNEDYGLSQILCCRLLEK